jgi:hypothetical protein
MVADTSGRGSAAVLAGAEPSAEASGLGFFQGCFQLRRAGGSSSGASAHNSQNSV